MAFVLATGVLVALTVAAVSMESSSITTVFDEEMGEDNTAFDALAVDRLIFLLIVAPKKKQ